MARKYSESDKKAAALATLIHGSSTKAAKQLSIPARTIRHWGHGDDWPALIESVRAEYEHVIRQKYSGVINASLDQISDRVTNGDFVFDKQGAQVRKPMSGKDLAIVNGVSFDKLSLILGRPTSIASNADSRITDLLNQFGVIGEQLLKRDRERAIEGEVLDVVSMANDGKH